MRCGRFGMRVRCRCCILRARLCRILPRVLRPACTVVRMTRTRRRCIGCAAMRGLPLLLALRLPLFVSLALFLSLARLLCRRLALRMCTAGVAAALRTALLALPATAA